MINYIMNNGDKILEIAAYIVLAASSISALTPTPKDDSIVAKLKAIIDMLALNKKK